jgi:hypothetical protein
VIPNCRRNVRRSVSADPSPDRRAITSNGASALSSSDRAALHGRRRIRPVRPAKRRPRWSSTSRGSGTSSPPAWKNLPAWAEVGTADKAAGSDIVRTMAQRAGADITEIEGSHVIMISRPDAVLEVILAALKAVS